MATEFSNTRSRVRICATGKLGSIPRTIKRAAPARVTGSPVVRITTVIGRGTAPLLSGIPDKNCACGKYNSGRVSWSSPLCLTSATTPTTARQLVSAIPPSLSRLPSGDSLGQNFRAASSLMTTTGVDPTRSSARSARPRLTWISIASR